MNHKLNFSLAIIAILLCFNPAFTQINTKVKSKKIPQTQVNKDRLRFKPPGTPAPAVADEGREIIRQTSLPAEAVFQTLELARIRINNLDWEIIEERSTRPRELSRFEGCDGAKFNFPICKPSGPNGIYFIPDARFSPVGRTEYEYEWIPSHSPPQFVSSFKIRFSLDRPATIKGYTENFRDRLIRDMVLESATLEITFRIGQIDYASYSQNRSTYQPRVPVEVTNIEVLELSLDGFNRAEREIKKILIANFEKLNRRAFASSIENCMIHLSRSKMPYELDLSKDHILIKNGTVYFDRIIR